MAKRTKIEPALFLCPVCKKNYFTFLEKVCCPECTKEKEKSVSSKNQENKEREKGKFDYLL